MTGRFHVGDRVRTRAGSFVGHTRLPGYLRGRGGFIEADHGAYALADQRARGIPANECAVEALYTVVFDGRAVWGDGRAESLTLSADLWDSYLEAEADHDDE